MSIFPGRRRGRERLAGAHARQIPAGAHRGSWEDFLRRHEMEAHSAAQGSARIRQEFAQCLFQRATDSRNIHSAIDYLATNGGPAPGPNGLRLRDLDRAERWELARALSESMRTGQYQAGPDRVVLIPKTHGNGKRPLRIQNVEDRVVQRAIIQVVQPFVDPRFSDRSYGYRPGRTREQALATAYSLAPERPVWIAEDARNAFEHVPHGRLLDVLRRLVPAENTISLIQKACLEGRNRGIRQGGPLSPLLLNTYLHWFVDSPWSRNYPDEPLVRVADDILVLCQDWQTARDRYDALRQMLRQAGMALKGSPEKCVRDLRAGQQVGWLGYGIGLERQGPEAHMAEGAWEGLEEHLKLAQDEADAPLVANQSILGWISQQGATYQQEDIRRVYARICSTARRYDFTEIPRREQIDAEWRRSFLRWVGTRREVMVSVGRGLAVGSAQQHVAAALRGRDGGASGVMAPSHLSLRREVNLYCDGSCLAPSRVGGWAYVLVDSARGPRQCLADSVPRTTSQRMELTAVIRGLEALGEPCRVHLTVDSQHVQRGITERLPTWKVHDWRTGQGKHRHRVANRSLWQRLDTLVNYHEVTCCWVRGHCGHPENELADRLAREAAERHVSGMLGS